MRIQNIIEKQKIGRHTARGFTLIEAIMVIVITGIIAGMVAVFMRTPVQGYMDSVRRAAITDTADSAARFMAREIQGAIPNSLRSTNVGNVSYLEFVPAITGGRYRGSVGINPADDPLSFDTPNDNSFDVTGTPITATTANSVVIGNLGFPGASIYDGSTRRTIAQNLANATNIRFVSTGQAFPVRSPGNRFQIAGTPVSYVCDPNTQRLLRYTGYGFNVNQPTNFNGFMPSVLATDVTGCAITFNAGVQIFLGLVTIWITISQNGESISLQHQVNVDNLP